MKVKCTQKDLSRALGIVSKAIGTNNTLPVLDNILLKAEGKKIYFSATDLEIAIKYSIEADVLNEGSLTVPAKLIESYVNLLPDEEVELADDSRLNLVVKTKRSDTKMKGIVASEYPLIPAMEQDRFFEVDIKKFVEAIGQTMYAASSNTTRPVLSGVLLRVHKEELKVVATDSYRLAEKKIALETGGEETIDCIVPAKTMTEVMKIFGKVMGKLRVSVGKNQILFFCEGIELTSRLIEGQFPPYEQIIPKKKTVGIKVKTSELAVAVKRISLFARENNFHMRLETTMEEGLLKITTNASEIGEDLATINAEYDGENGRLAVNSEFLLAALGSITTETTVIEWDSSLSPMVIRPMDRSDYIHIIMPLKID